MPVLQEIEWDMNNVRDENVPVYAGIPFLGSFLGSFFKFGQLSPLNLESVC